MKNHNNMYYLHFYTHLTDIKCVRNMFSKTKNMQFKRRQSKKYAFVKKKVELFKQMIMTRFEFQIPDITKSYHVIYGLFIITKQKRKKYSKIIRLCLTNK